MRRLIALFIALAGPFSSHALAAVVAEHTFSASEQGWTATTGADRSSFATFNAGDGLPPGSLHAADDARPGFPNRTWYFSSSNGPTISGFGPNPFYGNLSAAYAGTFSYDLKRFIDPGTGYADYDVRLHGVVDADMNGSLETALTVAFGGPSVAMPVSGWQSFSVPLVATAGWMWDRPTTDLPATEAQMLAVLSNLRTVEVRGNYSAPVGDYTGLDNVRFNSFVVPEPAAGVMMLITGLALTSRRRLHGAAAKLHLPR